MAILLAVYADASGIRASVALEVTFTTTPDLRARNAGSTACVIAITPKVLVSNTSRTVVIGVASKAPTTPSARVRFRTPAPCHRAKERFNYPW
jgi:hypothetical protein